MPNDKNEKAKVEDTKPAGPKSEDSKREGNPTPVAHTEGANRNYQDAALGRVGDTTSSTGGANNPGQHGRDGGEINEVSNNPPPSEEVITGERADDTKKDDKELKNEAKEIKKL